MKKIFIKKNTGFTLIEMMIAISVFLVVITIGIGSLLNAYKTYNKTGDMRAIMDNLNFTMDDMSKTIRTGTSFSCDSDPTTNLSCSDSDTLSLIDQDGYTVVYSFVNNSIEKTVYDTPVITYKLTDSAISFDSASGFTVSGADPNDILQPFVVIKLKGTITSKGNVTPFYLQTSVSQRQLDILSIATNNSSSILPYSAYALCAPKDASTSCNIPKDGTIYYGAINSRLYTGKPVFVSKSKLDTYECVPQNFNVKIKVDNPQCYFNDVSQSGDGGGGVDVGFYCNKDSDYYYCGAPKFTYCASPKNCGVPKQYCSESSNPAKYLCNKIFPINPIPKDAKPCDGVCSYDKDGTVYYGAKDNFYGMTVTGKDSVRCDYRSFGLEKPIENASCFYGSNSSIPVGPLPADTMKCNGDCYYKTSGIVYYGVNDTFYGMSVTGPGTTICTYSSFSLQKPINEAYCAQSKSMF